MEFDTELSGDPDGSNVAIPLPFDPKAVFGRARAPVVVTVNGQPPFRTTVFVYGGQPLIGLRKAQSCELGVARGDVVHVSVTLDTAPREVDVPDDLAAAFAGAPGAADAFQRLSYTHRKEYVRWITGAKRDETRRDRVAKAVVMIADGIPTPDAPRRT